MPLSERNRFKVEGVVRDCKVVPYGEGKSKTEFSVRTDGFEKDGVFEPQVVVFTLFGKNAERVQEIDKGEVVILTGFLQSRENQGRWWPDFRVTSIRTAAPQRSDAQRAAATDEIPW